MSALTPIFDIVLGGGILACASVAVFSRDRARAIVFFLAFGVLAGVLWARLSAPDIALAEVILGAGVTGALLMLAVGQAPATPGRPARRAARAAAALAASLAGVGVAAVLVIVLLEAGPERVALVEAVDDRLDDSGVSHPITAVLLNFRAYDTLLEVAVLAAAAWAAVAVAGAPAARGRNRPVPAALIALTRLLPPVVLLLAGWMLVAGSSRPGGAFQAGALLAAGIILLAGADRLPPVRPVWSRVALAVGVSAFLVAAFATAGAGWLRFPAATAGLIILVIESALTVGIAAALAAIFLAGARIGAEQDPSRTDVRDVSAP